MSKKIDSFFESPVDSQLNARILKNAESELKLNRESRKRKRWVMFFAPVAATLAAVVMFKLTSNKEMQFLASNSEQIELMAELIENDDVIDIAEDLTLLEELDYEELEYIQEIEVDDA